MADSFSSEITPGSIAQSDGQATNTVNVGQRSGGIRGVGRRRQGLIIFPRQAWIGMLVLLLIFLTIGASWFWIITLEHIPHWVPPFISALWFLAGIGSATLLYWMWREYVRFGNDLTFWASRLRKGDLGVRMPIRDRVCLSGSIREQINSITEDYLTVSHNLGIIIKQAKEEGEARTLSIVEERTRMAHELHDSLAQTLASLRFKVRLLDDTLHGGDEATIWQELEGLENLIDDAYSELRSLITNFRAPIDGKGVVRAVQNLTERFRKETDLEVFFYHNWNLESLADESELEVVRIVQEALNNVRKHSQASTVRILMYSSEEGRCSILVEDDGIGLPDEPVQPDPVTGEHLGMQIMQERAAKLQGELQFESDPDEGGTLLQLSFDAIPTPKAGAE